MKTALLIKYGNIEDAFSVCDFPEPRVKPDEILLRVKFTALNHIDIWMRIGSPYRVKLPHIMGSDICGQVVQEDKEGTLKERNIKEGDTVVIFPSITCGSCLWCLSGEESMCEKGKSIGVHLFGGYSELVSVPAKNVYKKPQNLTEEETTALPLAGITALHMFSKANVKPFDTVLIPSVGSGVGMFLLFLSKLSGLTVIATSSKDEKLKRAKEMGADFTINHTDTNWFKKVLEITEKGVDVAFEYIGGEFINQVISCVSKNGKIVTCGNTKAENSNIDIRSIFSKQITIIGSMGGKRAEFEKLLKISESGKVKPYIDSIFPLEDVKSAHKRLEKGEAFGKILLSMKQ